MSSSHFGDKTAFEHVVEAHRDGTLDRMETHGVEMSGSLSSFFDALRDTSVLLSIGWIALGYPQVIFVFPALSIVAFGVGWVVWRTGRSAWLGWIRLERLHQLLKEERYEIETHRHDERLELEALYRMKGFKEPLLQEVVDVLMADGDRLLKVMLQEEMGLSLGQQEHPLKQSCGAFLGSVLPMIALALAYLAGIEPLFAVTLFAFLLIGAIGSSRSMGYQNITHFVWQLMTILLSLLMVYVIKNTP